MTAPRLVLAIDAATEHIAIGIASVSDAGTVVLAACDFPAPRAALGAILPTVSGILASVDLTPGEIDVVAVGRGPGSFTGVRIAVATAKGLAQGLGVPLVGFGTLDAVAWRFCGHEGLVGVVGDAMRGEVYPCLFRCQGGLCERVDAYHVAKPDDAARVWADAAGEPVLLAGNGLHKYEKVFSGVLGTNAILAEESTWTPTGASVIAAVLAERESPSLADAIGGSRLELLDPAVLLPVYTRLSDAEEAEARRVDGPPASGVAGPGGGA